MSLGYLHLALNHLPVVGLAFGIALFAAALVKKSNELKSASLWAFSIIALLALAVFFTGESAEDMVEKIPGVIKSEIEIVIGPHEHLAVAALISTIILGFISGIGLVFFRKTRTFSKGLTAAVLVLSIISAGLMIKVANLGGKIRHTEIRSDAVVMDISGEKNRADKEHDKD
ncbi:MAG: hypothetical protein NTW44_06595 [Nitrospirae bacterium]|nr:hypothetical protein [Nitrospirota bacterium]